jgi:hypothetical protein
VSGSTHEANLRTIRNRSVSSLALRAGAECHRRYILAIKASRGQRGSSVGKRPKRAFTEEHIAAVRTKLQTVGSKTDRLMMKFVAHRFAEAKACEYARQGFARRIQTVRRCIENVFKIVPPNAARVPSKQRLHDAQINIQAAIANIYGCVDNLAWVWVYERGLSKHLKPRQVGLRKHNVQVRASLSEDFRAYLDTLEKWFEYLADFRHAVAHRIPLYPAGQCSVQGCRCVQRARAAHGGSSQ